LNILLTNDDGVGSIGILKLKESLDSFSNCVIVAPDKEKSTTSHSLTLLKPLFVKELESNIYSISGFPADCVYVGVNKILKVKPDLLISGINRGGNLGLDVYLSGTVAAARQAFMQNIPSIAFSLELLDSKTIYWDTAFKVAKDLVLKYIKNPIFGFININIPNIAYEDIKGYKITCLGEKEYKEEVISRVDPRDRSYCWIGGTVNGYKKIENSDCDAVYNSYVSITALKLDVTNYEDNSKLENVFL